MMQQTDSFKSIIASIKALDLSSYPNEAIYNLLQKLGQFGSVRIDFNVGKGLIRARPNESEVTYTARSDFSYKPAEYNNTYQRASTPFQTMLYGCPIPDGMQEGAVGSARVVATLEASRLVRGDTDGEEKISYGRWRVKKPIPFFVVCHHQDFVGRNSYMQWLHEIFRQGVEKMGKEAMISAKEISGFLASEFAKPIPQGSSDYEYMISAIFSEIMVKTGEVAGIYYPSVRSDGMIYNVAISPEYADENLELIAAGECTLYKRGKACFVDADTACLIEDDREPFYFKPVDARYHLGREDSLRRLSNG